MKLENVLHQIYANHTNTAHKKYSDNNETNPSCHIGGNLGTSIPSEPFYFRYAVSYRDLEEIMAEHGVKVDRATLRKRKKAIRQYG